MKPKPATKPTQLAIIGRLIILHARASNMAERMTKMRNDLLVLACEINKLREELRVKVEGK